MAELENGLQCGGVQYADVRVKNVEAVLLR